MRIVNRQSAVAAALLAAAGTSSAFVVQRSVFQASTPTQFFSCTNTLAENDSASSSTSSTSSIPSRWWKQTVSQTTAAALAVFLALSPPLPASANSYNSMSDEQKFVAEAWRLVDNSFLDRTFNGLDWFKLRQSYVGQRYESMDDAQASVSEMVSKLGDKYTRYLSPAKYQSLVDTATGSLAGIGVQIGTAPDGTPEVADVEPNSPASAAGLQIGDLFVEADGTRFDPRDTTPDDVAVKLRGPVGSKVGVVLRRGDSAVEVILTRQPITITAVRSYTSQVPGIGKVGVIRVKNFSGTTAATVAKELQALQGTQALVVDVRGNPGGLLPGGVDTASLFLPENQPLVFVVNKKGVVDAQTTLTAGPELTKPVVVLVDSNTGSAAEVFTAALKENDRAVIAGEQTFGKGIVQTIRDLSGGANGGLAITVARYETPRHNDINKSGIPVDVKTSVTCPKDDAAACLDASVFRKSK